MSIVQRFVKLTGTELSAEVEIARVEELHSGMSGQLQWSVHLTNGAKMTFLCKESEGYAFREFINQHMGMGQKMIMTLKEK